MSTSRFVKGIAALGVLVALAGCGKGEATDIIRVATFGDADIIKITKDRLADLLSKEGIRAEPVFIPYSNYQDKLLTQMAAGVAPDVIWVETSNFVTIQHAGALLPLDDMIATDKFDIKAHYPEVVARFSAGGKVYALPQDTAPLACVYYNKKMFRDEGLPYPKDNWKWADMIAAGKKLTKRDAQGLSKVYAIDDNGLDWATPIYSNGGRLVNDWKNPTRCTLDEPAAIEAIQYLADMMNVHRIMPQQGEQGAGSIAQMAPTVFAAGRLAMFHSGLWLVPGLRNAKDLEWDMVAYPSGPSAKHPGWGTGGSGWAINRGTKNMAKAWRVAQFLASEESQRVYMATGYVQPSIMALVKEDLFLKNSPPANKGFLVKAPQYAVYSPAHPRWLEMVTSIADPELNTVFRGKEKAGPVLKRIADRINATIFSKKP